LLEFRVLKKLCSIRQAFWGIKIEKTGNKNQIIEFIHDSPKRIVHYPSLASFGEYFVAGYETDGELKELIEDGEEDEFFLDLIYPIGYPI
jgi:hypothetical protein